MVRERLRFSDCGFIYFLFQKSISEGRSNREWGVHITELAIDSLWVTERITGEIRPDLRCQCWEWVGNARRLAFDFIGAEKAFSVAEVYLGQLEEQPQIKAQLYCRKAALRRWQRRLAEALDLNTKALSIFRSMSHPKAIVETLLESANIHEHEGELQACIDCLREALECLALIEERHLKFATYYNLASAFAKNEDHKEAEELLASVHDYGANQGLDAHISWLEGSIAAGLEKAELAEVRLLDAFQSFQISGELGYCALTALDLALHYTRRNEPVEVQRLVLTAIPIFESLSVHVEAAAALRLLRSGITDNTLTELVLRKARNCLERLHLDPVGKSEKGERTLRGSSGQVSPFDTPTNN